MKLRRFLNLRPPLFVFGIMLLLGVAFAIGLAADRIIRRLRERNGSFSRTPVR